MGVKLQGSIWDWAVVTTGSRGDRDVVKGGLYTWVLSNQGSSLWAQLRIIRERERERERERVREIELEAVAPHVFSPTTSSMYTIYIYSVDK